MHKMRASISLAYIHHASCLQALLHTTVGSSQTCASSLLPIDEASRGRDMTRPRSSAVFVARVRDVSLSFPPKPQRRPSLFRLVIGFVFKGRVILTATSPSPLGCCGVACSVSEKHSARMRLNAAPETSGPVGVSASWQLRVTAKEKESVTVMEQWSR